MVTKRQSAAIQAARVALAAHLRAHPGEPNPESLSRSYGLPLVEVERAIRSASHA